MDKNETFKFHYVAIPPTRQIGLHAQPTWELSYVLIGHGQRLIGNTTSAFREGDLVLVPPDVQHCWYFSPESADTEGNITCISIQFPPELLYRLSSVFPELSEILGRYLQLQDAISFSPLAAEAIVAKVLSMKDMDTAHRVARMPDLLVCIADHISTSQVVGRKEECDIMRNRLMQIQTFVACNYAHNISLGEIAAHLKMSRASFVSFVRGALGCTFISYLNEHRLQQAYYLLTHNTLQRSVSSIGYSVGFQSILHFNHLFKRRYGCSPKQIVPSESQSKEQKQTHNINRH